MKTKIVLDYNFTCTVQSLFRAISTSEGLSEWFAEKVVLSGNIYTFYWNKVPHVAIMVTKKDKSFIKFHWAADDKEVFEFRITKSDLIAYNTLTVTDLVDEEDIEESISLWNSQIEKLKRSIGCVKN